MAKQKNHYWVVPTPDNLMKLVIRNEDGVSKEIASDKTSRAIKRKGMGGKLGRTETVQVRLDPKLRYTAELAAWKERRTLSSFIEWAVERSVKEVYVARDTHGNLVSASQVADEVWNSIDVYRFLNLAANYPELLSSDEQRIWDFITGNDVFWTVPRTSGSDQEKNPLQIEDEMKELKAKINSSLSQASDSTKNFKISLTAAQAKVLNSLLDGSKPIERNPNVALIAKNWKKIENHVNSEQPFSFDNTPPTEDSPAFQE